jgi:carbonic anhydrase
VALSETPAARAEATRWRSVIRHDLPASIVVFLIAIPLSLGIAAASGAPLLAGLVAATVGGVVAGAISGAPLQVSGPAAGLTVIVAGLIDEYGWAATPAIVAMAGLLQIGLGACRLGRAALMLSPAVVHGMLAGIGVVIALGQVHVVLGGKPQSSALDNARNLPAQIVGHHSGSVLIGLLTVAILLLWPRLVRIAILPAALAAIALATATAALLRVELPRVQLPAAPLSNLALPHLPDGSAFGIGLAVLTVALVASVESLLSAVAVDRMHDGPPARLNRELVAQGAANTVSGVLGGLPVTGVIVRSSTNVAAGARSRAATILHGAWVAAFVLLCAGLLELIPMSALAAVLIVVGMRLVRLSHLREYTRHRELPVYLVTAAGVVLTDLMTGVAVGVALALLVALYRLARCEIRCQQRRPDEWVVRISGTLAFFGVARLARELSIIPPGLSVDVELHLDYLDHGAYTTIENWHQSYLRGGGRVHIREVHDSWFYRATAHRLGGAKTPAGALPRALAPWSQWQAAHLVTGSTETCAPVLGDAMLTGVDEFERSIAPLIRPYLADLARNGQQPEQLFITCADSRLVPNMITASGPGDLFCVRNIGNVVPPSGHGDHSVGAAVEYAVDILKVNCITVCGHSGCGAVRAMMTGTAAEDSELDNWLNLAGSDLSQPNGGRSSTAAQEEACCLANISQQLANLRTYPSVRQALAAGRVTVTGLYFDLAEARMYLVDPAARTRTPVPQPASAGGRGGHRADQAAQARRQRPTALARPVRLVGRRWAGSGGWAGRWRRSRGEVR